METRGVDATRLGSQESSREKESRHQGRQVGSAWFCIVAGHILVRQKWAYSHVVVVA